MTKTERKNYIDHLQNSQQALLLILEDVSEQAFQYKPSPESWSMAEIAEHIIKVETGIIGNMQQLGKSATDNTIATPFSNAEVLEKSADRSIMVNSPRPFIPTGIFKNKTTAIAAFEKNRQQVEHFVNTTSFQLKNIVFPHPRLGMLDGENWLVFIAGHCQRHVAQIAAIKEGLEG